MSSTFFALNGFDLVRDLDDSEVNVHNTNAFRIMGALGMEVDYQDHPAGELPLDEFLVAVERALATTDQRDMVHYMIRLRTLAWDARELNADTIAWA